MSGLVARGGEMRGHGSGTRLPGDGAGAACEQGLWVWRGCQSLKQSALLPFFFILIWPMEQPPIPPLFSFSLRLTDQRSTKRGKHAQSKIKIVTPRAQQNKLEQTNYRQSTHKQWSICGSLDCCSRWLPPTPAPPPPPALAAPTQPTLLPHDLLAFFFAFF